MCFSVEWIEQLLVWAVIIIAIISILKLLVPWILGQLGAGGGIIAQVINILFWAIICIFVIYICFAVIACLLSAGGHLSLLPHRY
jgi:uncharacterized BrkB/YihY/UPF0761 family membrane protein